MIGNRNRRSNTFGNSLRRLGSTKVTRLHENSLDDGHRDGIDRRRNGKILVRSRRRRCGKPISNNKANRDGRQKVFNV